MLEKPGGKPRLSLNFKIPARPPDIYGRWDRGTAFHPNSEVNFISSSAPCELWLSGSAEYVMNLMWVEVGAW